MIKISILVVKSFQPVEKLMNIAKCHAEFISASLQGRLVSAS